MVLMTARRLGVAILLSVAVAVLGAAAILWSLDSSVTRWHVPYQVVRHGVSYPLYDKRHCYTRAEIGMPLVRVGSESDLPLFAPPGRDPEVFYVQPKGHDCLMWYLSLENVG